MPSHRILKHLAPLFALLLVSWLGAACNVGATGSAGDGDGDGDGDGGGTGNGPSDGEQGLLCFAELTVSGTLTPNPDYPQPADLEGCFPAGTWTVQVELADQGDCDSVEFNGTYTYEVTPVYGTPDANGVADIVDWEYVWTDNPTDTNFDVKISEGGPGDCEADFEHTNADGTQVLALHPHERDLALTGSGSYELWAGTRQ